MEPGASEVLTQGLTFSPFCTALRAKIPAPSITDGFEVFVQLVIAAITTWPWSSSVSVPSASVTGTRVCLRSATCAPPVARWGSWPIPLGTCVEMGSLAGKLPDTASSSASSSGR